jgi:hypothetical protein
MDAVGVNLPAVIDHDPPLGSLPLRNSKHERFARHRSMLMPKVEAYRAAGFESTTDHDALGNACKLERKKDIIARVAWLCRQDEDILKAKRRRLEEFLWNIHEVNYADFFEPHERAELDEDGEETGYLLKEHSLKPFSALPPEHQHVIQSLKYTEKGRPVLEMYSKLQANQELRKMLGIGAVVQDSDNEYSRLADVELIATLRREAADLGIDVDLTYRFKGSEAA